jgi:hypothetical protein
VRVRITGILAIIGILAWVSISAAAISDRLTTIPIGRGTATIAWTGATGISPTVNSIRGTVGAFRVAGAGKVLVGSNRGSSTSGTASIRDGLPAAFPLADVKGTIGGTQFMLHIVLALPSSLSTTKALTIGFVTGTFRNQRVVATLTANSASRSFGFMGTVGNRHVVGLISQPVRHGDTETARATFNVTK